MGNRADEVDEVIERIRSVSEGKEPSPSSTEDYVYVVYVKGRWETGAFTGNASGCSAHIEKHHHVDLGDRETRWARGHIAPGGNFKIHPANDRDAKICIEEQLKRRLAQR